MNLENIRAWARLLGVAWNELTSGVIEIRPHDGSTLVIARPPQLANSKEVEPGRSELPEEMPRFVESDPVGRAVTNTLRAYFNLGKHTQQILSDARFSALGRADALKVDRNNAIANISHDWQKLSEYEVSLLEREHELFKVPQLAPGDSVGAIADWEVRQRVLGLSPSERTSLHAQLTRGEPETERVTLALNRSPFPLGNDETVARLAWRTAMEHRHADKFAALERDQEQLAWGQLTARRVAERVAKLSELSGAQLYDAAAKLDLARPNGPGVFFSNAAELRTYATRWRAEQERAKAA